MRLEKIKFCKQQGSVLVLSMLAVLIISVIAIALFQIQSGRMKLGSYFLNVESGSDVIDYCFNEAINDSLANNQYLDGNGYKKIETSKLGSIGSRLVSFHLICELKAVKASKVRPGCELDPEKNSGTDYHVKATANYDDISLEYIGLVSQGC